MKNTIIFITILTLSTPLYSRVTCKQLSNCQEACNYLAQGYGGLDRDKDGIPCESLCHSPCKQKKTKKKKSKKKS